MAIITYPLNGINYSAEDAESYLCTRTSGVYSAENNFALSISDTMQVSIGPGIAWIKNGDYKGKAIVSTEAVVIDVDIADGVLNRKDRIVIQFDAALNATNIVLKKGTAASIAEAPAITRTGNIFELGVYVLDITAGLAALQAANVANTMLDESVCGLMRDGVTQIPTANLNAKAEALIKQIEDTLAAAISGEVMPHSETHAIGGKDRIFPGDIGAAPIPIEADNDGRQNTKIRITDNVIYKCTNVSNLEMNVTTGRAHGLITFGSTVPTINVYGYVSTSGDDINSAGANETWEFDTFEGHIIWNKRET